MMPTMSGSLPEPLAQGDLARTPFAHLLLHVMRQELTGTLVLWNPEVPEGRPRQDRVVFKQGQPVAGVLLERASRLDRGMLPLFARAAGPFAFYEGVNLAGEGAVQTEVDVLALIAASLRGSSRDDVVQKVVAGFGDEPLRVTAGKQLDALGLLPKERACVDLLLAEPMPVTQLARLSPLDDLKVARLVYLLAITKAIEVYDAAPAKDAAPDAETHYPDLPLPDLPTPPPPAPPERPTRESGERRPKKRRTVEPGQTDIPDMPPGLSPEHQNRWLEITARAQEIEQENYFEMLSVARDASADAVQKAYLGLVKQWHPDRLPKEMTDLRPVVEAIFGHLTKAQKTLSDQELRGPYLRNVQEGGGTPEADRQLERVVTAAMEFQKVEVHMRRREYDQALELLGAIMDLNPDDADYHATYGWLLFNKHDGDESIQREATASLERALELTPAHDKAHYWLGMVLKRTGKSGEALQHFEKAAEVNPRHIEAVREVRLANMRKSDSGASRKSGRGSRSSGLLGKLFGGDKK